MTAGSVDSVLGPVPGEELGPTLVHEHLLVDTRTTEHKEASHRATPLGPHNYYLSRRRDDHPHALVLDSVSEAVDELRHFRDLGGRTLVEVTPRCLARNPAGLVAIARESGVNVVMGGGFYDHHYHQDVVHRASVDALAELLVHDCTEGVDIGERKTVRSGVIGEIGLSWPVLDCERKALVAASMAQAATGKALVIHPGRNPEGPRFALDEAERAGADPSRVVLSHIDRTLDEAAPIVELARRGAFVSFDLFGNESSFYPYSDFHMPNDGARLLLIRSVADLGELDQVVVSQDIYRKTHLLRYGGEGYGHILRDVVPVMDRFGLDAGMQRSLLTDNPARALTGQPAATPK